MQDFLVKIAEMHQIDSNASLAFADVPLYLNLRGEHFQMLLADAHDTDICCGRHFTDSEGFRVTV
jgi:hypothetical protein